VALATAEEVADWMDCAVALFDDCFGTVNCNFRSLEFLKINCPLFSSRNRLGLRIFTINSSFLFDETRAGSEKLSWISSFLGLKKTAFQLTF